MAEIVNLLQRVAQVARRCPTPTLVQAYRDAARKFCGESRWLRRELSVAIIAGQRDYALVAPAGEPLLEIIGARVVTARSSSGRAHIVNPSDPMGWTPSMQPGRIASFAYVPEASIAVWPLPREDGELIVTVECQPTMAALHVPDDLLSKWDQKLSDGALAYLRALPGQPWTDKEDAVRRAASFQASINNAKADVARAYNTGTVVARIPRVF
jgi:hypothetical protein